MLIGEYEHSIDAKGRIIFPVRLREDFGEKFIVTKGLEKCLYVYSVEEWQRLEDKIRALPMVQGMALQKFLVAPASLMETDKQGRILLPQKLREYAGLEKEAVVNGVQNRVEIWDPAEWDRYLDGSDEDFDEIFAKLAELGI